ncbi:MAG: SAM-dependent DNA methyltransferase [Clostridia bacterium]|nr:SAM-dependent DNA methyltransferase [Clostridia bacterium]
MSNRITIDELKSYLWNSAVFLRTNIDAGAYKQYIFPLLFFKRICDVYDEETQKALEEYGEDIELYPEEELHTFLVPKGHHWNDVREVTEDVGAAIVAAFREIEKANGEKMTGVFGDGAWTNKNRLPDRLLKDLLEHFSSKTLSLANCPEDELGQGYEYLIKQFADDSGHTAQEFYTNRTVVHLMTEMLKPQSGESVYDPTCGSAGMLISCIAYLKAQGKEWRNLHLYGQEINQLTSAIGRMNLFLHGIEDFHIVNDDTLKSPAFIEGGTLKQFDLVLANPPYSIKQWDRGAFENDKYGRNFLGTPPQGRADYAFFQHILKSLKPDTGRCAILFPHGVLFRDEENDMRKKLVESDLVECVIGIGKNLFFNSPMEACILICRTNKPLNRRGKVLFINAKKEVTRKNAQSYLEDEHIRKIASAYEDFCSVEGFSTVVPLNAIIAHDHKLSIPLYVRGSEEPEPELLPLEDAIVEWMDSSAALSENYAALIELLNGGDPNGKIQI